MTKLALNTISSFLGVEVVADTFPAYKQKLKKALRPEIDKESFIDSISGVWSFKDLVAKANAALDALHKCVNISDSQKKKWTFDGIDYSDQSGWSDLRLFGPVLTSDKGYYNASGKIDYPGYLPDFALGAIDFTHGKRKSDEANYVFVAVHRLDAFPPGIAPSADGFPYVASITPVFVDGPTSIQFFFTLSKSGHINCALHKSTRNNPVKTKRRSGKKGNGYNSFVYLPSEQWKQFDPLIAMMKHEKRYTSDKITSPGMVGIAMNQWFELDGSIIASFQDDRGKINVPIKTEEAKKLFSRRIKVKTKTGRTKPIIHWVKSHMRVNGSAVKTHWRGLKDFDWMGMKVKIRMPGKGGSPLVSEMGCLRQADENIIQRHVAKILRITNACREEVEFIDATESGIVGLYYRPKQVESRHLH